MRNAQRNSALLNGALIAGGLIAIVDNLVAHWVLGLHRAVPGGLAGSVEVVLVGLGVLLLVVGLWREAASRNNPGR